MGRRGPQKTPTARLANRGSWLVKDRAGEPKVCPGCPECPDWLTGESKEIWYRLVPELVNLGVMSKMDGFAFSRYCVYAVLWLKELGNPARNVLDFERYANQLLKLEGNFGLNPSSRASLNVNTDNNAKKEDKFLRIV